MASAGSRKVGFDCPHCRRKPECEDNLTGGEGSILQPCSINGNNIIVHDDDRHRTNRQQSASMQENGVVSRHPIITHPNADHASNIKEGIITSTNACSLHDRQTIKEEEQGNTHTAGQGGLASFGGLSIKPPSDEDDHRQHHHQHYQTIDNCKKRHSVGQGISNVLENDGADVEKSDLIVCFGEMLIDFVPTVGGYSLAEAPSFKKAPGGAPANVAVAIARLGGHSAFIGKVGDDEFGHMLKGILMHYGVDSTGLRFDANARTALAFVTLRDDGEREFMFYRNPSADMLLQENELDLELISRASIFHYGSISLISEPCRSAHIAAMRAAKSSGALLSYDPNVRLPLWPSAEEARKGIMSIWTEADLIKVSDEEIAFLMDGQDPTDDDVVMQLWHPGLKLFLITEGQEGCRYYTKEFHGKVPGFKVSAIDTTGAGDAFVGGILSQLVSDKSLYEDEARLREALRFANACGALTTTERGAIPALPDKDSALRLTTRLERSQSLTRVPSWQNISHWRVPSRQQSREILEEDLMDHHK